MRKIKLLYVENDGALRGLLSNMLGKSEIIEVVSSFSNSSELLESGLIPKADAALIDFSLEQGGLNGIELGIHLRNLNEHIGVVIYSQFSVAPMVRRVPQSMLSGWSFLDKSATSTLQQYEEVVKASVNAAGNWAEISTETLKELDNHASIFFKLTPRQRSIMALASKSKSAREIALQLDISYAHVRRELSRAYEVLLPDATPSDDLKTAAVLRYLELMDVTG